MRSKRLLAKAKVAKQQELQATPTPPPKSSSQRQVNSPLMETDRSQTKAKARRSTIVCHVCGNQNVDIKALMERRNLAKEANEGVDNLALMNQYRDLESKVLEALIRGEEEQRQSEQLLSEIRIDQNAFSAKLEALEKRETIKDKELEEERKKSEKLQEENDRLTLLVQKLQTQLEQLSTTSAPAKAPRQDSASKKKTSEVGNFEETGITSAASAVLPCQEGSKEGQTEKNTTESITLNQTGVESSQSLNYGHSMCLEKELCPSLHHTTAQLEDQAKVVKTPEKRSGDDSLSKAPRFAFASTPKTDSGKVLRSSNAENFFSTPTPHEQMLPDLEDVGFVAKVIDEKKVVYTHAVLKEAFSLSSSNFLEGAEVVYFPISLNIFAEKFPEYLRDGEIFFDQNMLTAFERVVARTIGESHGEYSVKKKRVAL